MENRVIKTTAFLLQGIASTILKHGCDKCGTEIGNRLCYIKQIDEMPALRYEILCEDCWRAEE